jgi:hypothetical protein
MSMPRLIRVVRTQAARRRSDPRCGTAKVSTQIQRASKSWMGAPPRSRREAAATPPGSMRLRMRRYRWYRCAQPPANVWHPFGMALRATPVWRCLPHRDGSTVAHPGAMAAISRGLSAAIPPVAGQPSRPTPEGSRRHVSANPPRLERITRNFGKTLCRFLWSPDLATGADR